MTESRFTDGLGKGVPLPEGGGGDGEGAVPRVRYLVLMVGLRKLPPEVHRRRGGDWRRSRSMVQWGAVGKQLLPNTHITHTHTGARQ